MLVTLILSIGVLFAFYQMSLRTLEEEQLSREEATFRTNAKALDDMMYSARTLPYIVIGDSYVASVSRIDDISLPDDYVHALHTVKDGLRRQNLINGDSYALAFYFKNTDCFASSKGTYFDADSFFDAFQFSDTDREELFEDILQFNTISLLPAQTVLVNGRKMELFTVIVCPLRQRISVLAFYEKQTILNKLGSSSWPDGSSVEIVSRQGETVLSWPEEADAQSGDGYYEFTAELKKTRAFATLRLSKAVFASRLKKNRAIGLGMVLLTMVIGLALSFFLSRISVAPVRKLLQRHKTRTDITNSDDENELQALDHMLTSSRLQRVALQGQLRDTLLMKVYSGGLLEDPESDFLKKTLFTEAGPFLLAILLSNQDPDQLKESSAAQHILPITWVRVGVRQTLVVSEDSASAVTAFSGLSEQDPEIRIGISAPFNGPSGLRQAIRQAQTVIPPESGTNVYSGTTTRTRVYSRLQHERLYQSIMTHDMETAQETLLSATEHVGIVDARETYYNIRFTMTCAAEELELGTDFLETEYNPDKRVMENMAVLSDMLKMLFSRFDDKQKGVYKGEEEALLSWIKDNALDSEINAMKIAEEFHTTEKKVYETVRANRGMSLNEYILSLRMQKAGRLLYSSTMSVGEIGRLCGFEAESTFFRVFKKYYGMRPSEYRRKGAL
ncbi:MAG: helix-turn-helix domain-containing protein [Lachnospiraceae bacterium]|nr:helix-turn-helix domain-containing protein [Lachnospiraceae bacterium]